MVGAVIIAHSSVGKGLLGTAEYIVGKIEGITSVSIVYETNVFEARKRISEAIKEVDEGDGILLLIDLFGGSPSNIAFSFLNNEKVEVITGVNLPMVLTFWNKREGHTLREVVKAVQLSGLRSINRAKTLMEIKSDKERVTSRERGLSSQKQ